MGPEAFSCLQRPAGAAEVATMFNAMEKLPIVELIYSIALLVPDALPLLVIECCLFLDQFLVTAIDFVVTVPPGVVTVTVSVPVVFAASEHISTPEVSNRPP